MKTQTTDLALMLGAKTGCAKQTKSARDIFIILAFFVAKWYNYMGSSFKEGGNATKKM